MKSSLVLSCVFAMCFPTMAGAQILNPGFEDGFAGWAVKEASGSDVSESGDARSGAKSAKVTAKTGVVEQTVSVSPNTHYQLESYNKGAGLLGVKIGDKIYFDRKANSRSWDDFQVTFNSDNNTNASIFLSHNGAEGRFDDVSLTAKGRQGGQKLSPNVVSKSSGGTGLSPELAPSQNFDLTRWYLSVPTDKDNSGTADSIYEAQLNKRYQNSDYFFTGPDGGMVFKSRITGFKTSKNTNYTRVELREMLRRGDKSISTKNNDGTPNKNNWAFSSAPQKAQNSAGAVDGVLEATLAVNHVTTTGAANEVGRFIIGQIHAKDDEPIRLYYRKLPQNNKGSVYFAHESKNQDKDQYFDLIGSRNDNAPNPANGFTLNEKFSYKIQTIGNTLRVSISQDGVVKAKKEFDMSASGYDVADDYMYFKAGVYNQNKTGSPEDYDQATFYKLSVTH